MEQVKADLCVIGAGSAGLNVAAGAAQLGRKVVLVEKGEMGGDCLNAGCVPSKALIAAANRAQAVRDAAPFGVRVSASETDAARAHTHVHETIATIAPNDSEERLTGLGVRVIRAAARFRDAETVEAGDAEIRARRFVIATGSRPFVPPLPGLDKIPFFTNETIFANDFMPPHLIVIGGGPVGVELAQAHRRLGSQVTIIEADRVLPREDIDISGLVCDALIRDGVRLLESSQATSITQIESGVRLQFVSSEHSEKIEGSHILVATGRSPNVENLNLEAANVAHGKHGIAVDHSLKTTNKRIYAIGDVTGAPQFTHVAAWHAGLVIRNALFRLPVRADRGVIPRVTYTDPELAHVGLTEAEARAKSPKVRVAQAEFSGNDRAVIERRRDGKIKVVLDGRARILGATIVGAHAGELIVPWMMAIRRRAKLREMADLIVPYPSLSEISKRAAGNFYAPTLFSKPTRLLVRALAWF